MTSLLLSSQNVFKYLIEKEICDREQQNLIEQNLINIERKVAKNFNLLLSLPEDRKILIKQESRRGGKVAGELFKEWRIQELLHQFPELTHLHSWLPKVLYFDAENSIIVFNYLSDYQDLLNFYVKDNVFPTAIASTIGTILGTIHHLTLERQNYRDFFPASELETDNQAKKVVKDLERIDPEVFAQVPEDGLKFFTLYQRFDSLGQAIAELLNVFTPCCLTHNDLKLNNILVPNNWQESLERAEQFGDRHDNSTPINIRIIDWERSSWGDPGFDLGMLIASYLQIWLNSLISSNTIPLEECLRLATTPLELLQPSIAALTQAYLHNFPKILERRPDFLRRVVQFSGLALIQAIQATLQHRKTFGNQGICMLQVAKTLLCRPEASILTVFGVEESKLTSPSYLPA